MLMLTFEITDDNEILTINLPTWEVFRTKVSPDVANQYRKKLDEEIMIRTYIYNI